MSSIIADGDDFFQKLERRRLDIENTQWMSAEQKQNAWSEQLRDIQTFMVKNRKLQTPLTPPPDSAHGPAPNMVRIGSQKRSLNADNSMTRSKTNMPPPQSYTAPMRRHASSNGRLASTLPPFADHDIKIGYTSYEPAEYVNAYSELDEETHGNATKRQRTDPFDVQNMYSHALPSVYSDELSSFSSMNSTYQSTYSSDYDSSWQYMSRQPSNHTAASVEQGVQMMNVKSSFSTISDCENGSVFPFSFQSQLGKQDELLFPPVNDDVQRLAAMRTPILNTDVSFCDDALLADVGFAGDELHGLHIPSNIDTDETLLSVQNKTEMQRSDSGSSNLTRSASSEIKATARRRKHIENSKQLLAPRADMSVAMARDASGSHSSGSKSGKQAIERVPYCRPKQERHFCDQCNSHPEGFHGIHELRRHCDRLHAGVRKVWMCVEPQTKPNADWPAKPLSVCKHCNDGKKYGVYYNAAAHIRRTHFAPRKRGRRPRGAEKESRQGKAGGSWPTIEWLKINGWLKEVTITADELVDDGEECKVEEPIEECKPFVRAIDRTFEQDIPWDSSQQAFHASVLGLAAAPLADVDIIDLNLGRNALLAPGMQSSASAPGALEAAQMTSILDVDVKERLATSF